MSDAGQADALQEGTLRFACAELDRRLRAGEGCRVEQLLADRPLLAACEDAAVELIHTEFVTREELGQRPTPEEFCARFPAWGRLVALKVLRPEQGRKPRLCRRLRRFRT
jgi:hypothetical protein